MGMLLSTQLKKLLSKNSLSVPQLARVTGVSNKTLYSWLDGKRPNDLNAVKKVADHFDVSLDYLLFNVIKHDKKISFEDLKDEISLGVLELIVRKPKTRSGNS